MEELKACDLRLKSGNCIIGCQPCKNVDAETCTYIRRAYDGGYGDGILVANRRAAPENKPLTCDGCEHNGKYENEYEYGYPSPCTGCKRRAVDNYARKPE